MAVDFAQDLQIFPNDDDDMRLCVCSGLSIQNFPNLSAPIVISLLGERECLCV